MNKMTRYLKDPKFNKGRLYKSAYAWSIKKGWLNYGNEYAGALDNQDQVLRIYLRELMVPDKDNIEDSPQKKPSRFWGGIKKSLIFLIKLPVVLVEYLIIRPTINAVLSLGSFLFSLSLGLLNLALRLLMFFFAVGLIAWIISRYIYH